MYANKSFTRKLMDGDACFWSCDGPGDLKALPPQTRLLHIKAAILLTDSWPLRNVRKTRAASTRVICDPQGRENVQMTSGRAEPEAIGFRELQSRPLWYSRDPQKVVFSVNGSTSLNQKQPICWGRRQGACLDLGSSWEGHRVEGEENKYVNSYSWAWISPRFGVQNYTTHVVWTLTSWESYIKISPRLVILLPGDTRSRKPWRHTCWRGLTFPRIHKERTEENTPPKTVNTWDHLDRAKDRTSQNWKIGEPRKISMFKLIKSIRKESNP